MRIYLKNIFAFLFLIVFLPYTITLLLNGWQGIHQEEKLPTLEYQTLYKMMQEDFSWMEDETLELMAILYRTECVQDKEDWVLQELSLGNNEEAGNRVYQAVIKTKGKVVQVEGTYRQLPYHMVSAGTTREGRFLGEDYSYVNSVTCPFDLESGDYLQICSLTWKEIAKALNTDIQSKEIKLERDGQNYVIDVSCDGFQWKGENFRTLLHLPSSCFFLEETEEGLRITTKGSGHGFGISLYTANRMAREGASYEEMIQKFYQGAECITIP